MTTCQDARVVNPVSFINMSGGPGGPGDKTLKHHFEANGGLWNLVLFKKVKVVILILYMPV